MTTRAENGMPQEPQKIKTEADVNKRRERRIETAFFMESRVEKDSQAYEVYKDATDVLHKFGANAPQIPPMLQRLQLSLSSFFYSMPNALQLFNEVQRRDTKIYNAVVLSLGINRLSGGGTNVDGSYLAPCRSLLYNLRMRDLEQFMQPSPARYVYTGLRLIDLFFKYAMDWLNIIESRPTTYVSRLKQKLDIDTEIQPYRDAIDQALCAVWDMMQKKARALAEREYQYCDSRTSLCLTGEYRLEAALKNVVSVYKRFFLSEKDQAIESFRQQLERILTCDHPLYVPKGDPEYVYSPPSQTISVKEQLQTALANNEREVHVLEAFAAASTAICGVFLQPVFMAFEWRYRNDSALLFAHIGIGLTLASMVFSLASYVPIIIAVWKPSQERGNESYSLNDLHDYRHQAKFNSGSEFADILNRNADTAEKVQLHRMDYILAGQVIDAARKRYCKRNMITSAAIFLLLALASYGSAMLYYIDLSWGWIPVMAAVLLTLIKLIYVNRRNKQEKARRQKNKMK